MAENELGRYRTPSLIPAFEPLNKNAATQRIARSNGGLMSMTGLHVDVGEEMNGEFTITSVENFFKFYMPFEPTDDDVDNLVSSALSDSAGKLPIMQQLGNEQILRFVEFPEAPSRSTGTEGVSFQPLQSIADAVSATQVQNRTRNRFNFRLCPESRIASDIPGSNNKIDACIAMGESGRTQNEVPNNLQVVSANVQIMNDDVRRMFTYGVTIVKDMVTLWYHSRSHSAISENFNFVENPKTLLKVFMSFLFATEVELGYDPMVTREPTGQYLFRVPKAGESDRLFRTVRVLSEYRSNNITGRMARIWLVNEVRQSDGSCIAQRVLKDVWLDESAATEKEIQSKIFEKIENYFNLHSPTDPRYTAFERLRPSLTDLAHDKEYKKYFTTIVTDHVGMSSKPVAPDSRRITQLFSKDVKRHLSRLTHREPCGVPRPTKGEGTSEALPRDRIFAPKKQYRVIFKEVCQTVGDLRTVSEVASVLEQTLVALRLLCCAGWVHRDISSGNILADPIGNRSWQAKLSDLEYAREYPPSPDSKIAVDPKTGTPYFMPHEILSSKYLYDATHDTASSSNSDDSSFYNDSDNSETDDSETGLAEPAVIYNFQHDLESVWWIFLWTLTCRVDHNPSNAYGKPIFRNSISLTIARDICFTQKIARQLKNCLQRPLRCLGPFLNALRRNMMEQYIKRGRRNALRDPHSYSAIHIRFSKFFTKINESRESWGDTNLRPSYEPTPSNGLVSKLRRKKRDRDLDQAEYIPSGLSSDSVDSEGAQALSVNTRRTKKVRGG